MEEETKQTIEFTIDKIGEVLTRIGDKIEGPAGAGWGILVAGVRVEAITALVFIVLFYVAAYLVCSRVIWPMADDASDQFSRNASKIIPMVVVVFLSIPLIATNSDVLRDIFVPEFRAIEILLKMGQ